MNEENNKTLGDLFAEKYHGSKEATTPTPGIPVDTTKKDILSGLLSEVNNDFIEIVLPSKNVFYEEDTKVMIKPFTYEEEKMLLSSSKIGGKNIINNMMGKCVKGVSILDLTLPDKIYLLFKLREISYGTDYNVLLNCLHCEEPNEMIIPINELTVNYIDEKACTVKQLFLPGSKRNVEVTVPRSRDEDLITKPSKLMDNLWRFVNRVEDIEDKDIIRAFVKKLPAQDVSKLRNSILNEEWGLETKISFHCMHCEEKNDMDLPLTADFFSASSEN